MKFLRAASISFQLATRHNLFNINWHNLFDVGIILDQILCQQSISEFAEIDPTPIHPGHHGMPLLLNSLAALFLLGAIHVLAQGRVPLAKTSLKSAWYWAAIALTFFTTLFLAVELFGLIQNTIAAHAYYLSAILWMTPFMAALGARWPGTKAWNWFVVLPMVIVLAQPSWSTWATNPENFGLEAPWLIGFGFVLIMGVGNYMGTRFTLSAVLMAGGLVLLVCETSPAISRFFPEGEVVHRISVGLITSGVMSTLMVAEAPCPPNPFSLPCARLWIDFRDWFGIVWARRVQDRVNQAARDQNWPLRVELHGVTGVEGKTERPLPEAAREMEKTFRWLLKRFVDDDWIEYRLQAPHQFRTGKRVENEHN